MVESEGARTDTLVFSIPIQMQNIGNKMAQQNGQNKSNWFCGWVTDTLFGENGAH